MIAARTLANATLVSALLLVAPTGAAWAATCGVTVPGLLNFGNYDTVNTLTPAAWVFTVTCSRTASGNTTETLSITDTFSVGSGTYTARTMSSGADTLSYNLYADSAYTLVRGDGSGGTFAGGPAAVTLTKSSPNYTATGSIYGRIPGGQNVAPGVYTTTQSIMITLSY